MTTPPNLLPFDLEKAKAGAKVVTKMRKPVRIFAYDYRSLHYPLGGAITEEDGNETFAVWTKHGHFYIDGCGGDSRDLFLLPEVEYADFTMETVPLDAWFKQKIDKIVRRAESVNVGGISVATYGYIPFDMLAKHWQYTLSPTLSNAEWHECRREVRE